MKNKYKLAIVIPCLNEKSTIKESMARAYFAGTKYFKNSFRLIIADNGSRDGSVGAIKKFRKGKLVNVPIRGYGAALHWGIMNSEAEYVFFADADLSYDFDELKKFIPFIRKKYDLILGSRFKGKIHRGAMPFLNRYIGTPLLTLLINGIYGLNTTDSNSGMRVVRTDFYKKLRMRNSGMEWDSELLIKTKLHGGKYKEVPINLYPDKRDSAPRLSRFTDGWRNLKTIILIRPNILLVPVFLLISLATLFWNKLIILSYLFILFAFALLLSILPAHMLNYVVDLETDKLVRFTNKPIVFIVLIINISVVFLFLAFPAFTKSYSDVLIIFSGMLAILDIWIFFIETIKTHLINPLPDKLS